MSTNKKVFPLKRANKFFSAEDFELELQFGKEYISDLNMSVILYRVDKVNTMKDATYAESIKDGIRYLPPVELDVIAKIDSPSNELYNKQSGSLRYLQDGALTFGVYDSHLKELGVEVSYGDYIGYVINETTIRYYTVINDGIINSDNAHTILGVKGVYRSITCRVVDASEFNGL